MKTIFKYVLDPDHLTVSMPICAQVLAAQVQKDQICLWAEVDDSADKELVEFEAFGTGHNIPENPVRHYIDTVQMHGGNLVFHIYQVGK